MGLFTLCRRLGRALRPGFGSEARFRNLVEGSIQGIYVHDTKRVVFANQACANIFGYDSPHELYQLDTVFRLNAAHEIGWMRELGAARQRGEKVKTEYYFDGQRRDGSTVRLHMMARPVMWDGMSCNQCVVVDVSARQRAERAVTQSEQRFRRLFEAAPVALAEQDWSGFKALIDRLADCNVGDLRTHFLAHPDLVDELATARVNLDVNSETLRIYRATDKQAFMHWARQTTSKDVGLGLFERAWRLAAGERRVTVECDVERLDGEIFPARITSEIVDPEGQDWSRVYTSLQDITEERAAAAQIRSSEERFRDILEVISDRIWEVDANLRFTAISGKGDADVLDLSQDIGRTGSELSRDGRFSAVLSDDEKQAYKTALREQRPFYNVLYRAEASAGDRYLEISGTPRFGVDREFLGYRGAGRDVTDRHLAQQALQRANMELEDKVTERTRDLALANEQLLELDRLKSMFIASMSHELRTPLNSIIGFTGIILEGMSGELSATQSDHLSRVYGAAKHLLALISDVIDISKIEAGMTDIFPEPVDVGELARECASTFETQLESKALRLNCDTPGQFDVVTDRRRLLQCILNLIGNAIKYTEQGEISVTLRETHDAHIEVEVADTGIGIPEDQLSRLFQPFERIDSHLLIGTPGTGLGLYLTQKLASDVLEGEVRVSSELGKGSVFTLRLPKHIRH